MQHLRLKLYLISLIIFQFAQAQEPPSIVRQRPGEEQNLSDFQPQVYESIPDIESFAPDFVPVPDRWRQFYAGKWYDPYNQNVLKGDIPVFGSPGHEWFFETSIISDSSFEYRKLPIPVGAATTNNPDSINTFGKEKQAVYAQNLVTSFAFIRGNTTFMPPEIEFRFVPVINLNHVEVEEDGALRVDPSKGNARTDNFIGFQELFIDKHLFNLSERYDFVSTRIGMQQFSSDFRGFIFASSEPGIRFFGNYNNNKIQYNLAWFDRLDKDTNSGINTFDQRFEQVYVANLYYNDAFTLGHNIQFSLIHRQDQAGSHPEDYDNNGALVRPASIGDQRPKNLYSTYFGFNTDGHIGRVNITSALYYVNGEESHNPIAGRSVNISAGMAALELSYDVDWIRFRSSFMWASGDSDPFDDQAGGFDSIIDNPNFAGGDIGYIQRQGIPFIGGGGVALINRNSFYPDLKAGKEEGQSNFVNPGLLLYNLGADFELTQKFKLITNASFLQFDNTSSIEALRNDASIGRNIGVDLSAGVLYRPFLNNNVQIRAGGAFLMPGNGTEDLYGNEVLYDFFSNLILQY